MTGHDGFTYGTLLVGCVMVVWELADWAPGRKQLMKAPLKHVEGLWPFLWTWAVGALMVMCVGGLVGWATGWFVWGAGWLGDAALVWGVGGAREAAPAALSQPLTNGGLFMTVLLICFTLVRLKRGGFQPSKRRGVVGGITMGLSAGVAAALAVPLASGVNLAGAWITGGPL